MKIGIVVLMAVFLGIACSDESDARTDAGIDLVQDMGSDGGDMRVEPPELAPRGAPGSWLAGDFHVHATGASNDTGGDSPPSRIKEVAVERGLDFVVLTDHSNSTGSDTETTDEDPLLFNLGPEFPYWDLAAMLSDATFLMVDGNEMSPVGEGEVPGPTGHIGCFPRDLTTFDPTQAFTDRPRGTVNGAQTIEQARDAGCYVNLNHPFGPAPWISFDWTSRDYDGVEIYNGSAGWDRFDYQAMMGFICDISLGMKLAALGGSDNHRVNIEPPGGLTDPPLGWPTSYVFGEGLSWPTIIGGLDARRTSVSDTGTPLDWDLYAADGGWLGMSGDEVDAAAAKWGKVAGKLDNTDKTRVIQIIRVGSQTCQDPRREGSQESPLPEYDVVFEVEVAPGEEFSYQFALEASEGEAYIAWLHPGSDRVLQQYGVAFTSPIWVR